MKSPIGLLLVLLMALTGCSSSREAATTQSDAAYSYDRAATKAPGRAEVAEKVSADTATTGATKVSSTEAEFEQVSLTQADTAAAAAEAADRKIIRNANLTLEVSSTTQAQQKVTLIAESHGGFVVTSEAKQRETAEPANRTLDIKLVVRVPAERFSPALEAIRSLANTTREDNVTGTDVTEEFIDLEARIRTQKALELQFLEIMKQARKVEDAMEVQRQIAEVRTDIEKLEGRKRFLENRSSLSTIIVNLEAPRPIAAAVTSTGFGRSLRAAVSEGFDVGSAIVLFLVRFVIVMIPISVFLLLPLGLLFRYFVRRAQRMRLAASLANPVPAAGE